MYYIVQYMHRKGRRVYVLYCIVLHTYASKSEDRLGVLNNKNQEVEST